MRRAVIDQPGARIFFIGLALSAFLGLALRSQISESRVQVFLNKSIDRLQADFYIDYESAKVSLSRWGLPLPALIVQNLRLSPKSTICQSSQIFIEELEVPISVSALLGLSKTIPKIRVKEIELRLSDLNECVGQKKSEKTEDKTGSATIDQPAVGSAEADFKNIFSKNTKAELKEIYIEKLKIISKSKPDQPLLLKQINFELFYTENRLTEVQIKSKISALKDSRSDLYFLNSGFVAVIKAHEKNEIEALININGKLLDGDIQFFAHSFSGSNKVTYELGLQQVSIKALAPLLENVEFFKGLNTDKTPISVSLLNNGEIFLTEKPSIVSKFKKIQINVENGLIRIADLDTVYAENRVSVKPFVMNVESLSLTKLKYVDQYKNRLDSLESMGNLSGSLEFSNENLFRFKGQIKNIKAVFSNRGRRDLQTIESVAIDTSRSGNDLRFEAYDFTINNQKAAGQLKAHYNTVSFTSNAQLKLSDVTLNSKVWEQFTFVEQSPRIDIVWNYRKAEQEVHSLKIVADKIALPGIHLENLNVDINHMFSEDNTKNYIYATIRPAKLTTDAEFLKNDIISEVFNIKNGFKLTSLNSKLTNMVLTGPSWKNISFNLDSHFLSDTSSKSDTHLSLKGSVNYEEGFDGRLVMQNRNFTSRFDLTRDEADKIVIKQLP